MQVTKIEAHPCDALCFLPRSAFMIPNPLVLEEELLAELSEK